MAFPLHPETPEQGRTLEDLFAGRDIDIAQKLAHFKNVAAAEGLPFGERKMTFNSRRAQELGKWAETEGQGDAFHQAVFEAYFAEGRNIAMPDVLVELSESIGLSGAEAGRVLTDRSYRNAVDRDWQRSRDLGITAVPTFLYANQMLVGAHPLEMLRRLIQSD